MRSYTFVVILALILDGCANESYGPEDNHDFYHVSQLSELTGVYKNEGDEGNPNLNFHRYLSEDIWGYKSNLLHGVTGPNLPAGIRHEEIEFIEVSSTENSLNAKAIKNGCVVYDKTYFAGKDFEIKDGHLVIRKHFDLLGAQDIVIGPTSEELTLGIDTVNQGKARSTLTQVGGAIGVLPYLGALIALPYNGTVTRDVRYERVLDKPQGFKACEQH